ncbi:uncharacterized protein LOC135089096 [Scylla paramamosain]|uniref:uncharacterized protein LOC135089096 n=1 Tax=Scylla paramamosain TaxID=85552 RepID=UPI003082E790
MYTEDLLRQIPTLFAYADDCSLSRSYCRSDSQRTVRELNRQLRLMTEWGETWQVGIAPEKTQAMVISRSPAAPPPSSGNLMPSMFWRPDTSPPGTRQGVGSDSGLWPTIQPPCCCCCPSELPASLCPASDGGKPRLPGRLYTVEGSDTALYGVQCLVLDVEYRHPLAETGCRATACPAAGGDGRTAAAAAGGADRSHVSEASAGRVGPRAVQRESRTTTSSDMLVQVPRSHSRQYQRFYTARTSRLWNLFTAATSDTQ